jgi:hypothetical protein
LIQLREIPRTQAQTRAREPRKDTRSLAPSPERRSQRRTRSRRDSHNLFTMSNNESNQQSAFSFQLSAFSYEHSADG